MHMVAGAGRRWCGSGTGAQRWAVCPGLPPFPRARAALRAHGWRIGRRSASSHCAQCAAAARAAAPTYKINVTQKLNATFANKTRAEINRPRDQVVAQARSQYAGDPRTRDKVIALLQPETAMINAIPAH